MRYATLFVFALFLFVACATTADIAQEDRTRVFDAPQDAVHTAILDAFSEYAYPIETSDREAGLINTGYKRGGMFDNSQVRLNARLSGENGGTSVTLLITAERVSAGGGVTSAVGSRSQVMARYDEMFDAIESELD